MKFDAPVAPIEPLDGVAPDEKLELRPREVGLARLFPTLPSPVEAAGIYPIEDEVPLSEES